MPPKPKGGKKKGKLSAAEKEKLRKEEALLKAQEEEEARLHAEQEEREREERERLEHEQRRIFEEQERVRHQVEVDELNQQLEENEQYLLALKKKKLQNDTWNRYMLCDGRPDPTDKKEINTFINLTKENMDKKDIGKVLKKCELILELIDELRKCIQNIYIFESEFLENEENKLLTTYQELIQDLQKLISEVLDESVLHILKTPGRRVDVDTSNIQTIEESKNIKMCLWGNSAKNPRIKQVEFDRELLTMELPKQMALADIAVRVLFVKFDFLSPQCSTYSYKPKTIHIMEETEDLPESQVVNENEELTKYSERILTLSPAPSHKTVLSAKDSRKSNKSRASVASFVNNRKGDILDGNELSTGRLSVTEGEDIITVNLDKSHLIDDGEFIEEGVIDLRSYAPLGPLVSIELLKLPAQAKEVKNWIMQEATFGGLERLSYGVEVGVFVSSITLHRSSSTPINLNEKLSSLGYNLPLMLSLRLDDRVIFHEEPTVARWDDKTNHWSTDGISDVTYKKEENLIFFRTACFGTFATMQDIYLNFPFQSWLLRPTGLNECILNICGVETEIDIIIKEDKCSVKFPHSISQVNHLTDKWMAPQELIKLLQSAGVNMFPYEDGSKYVSICPKLDSLIQLLYKHMALAATSFTYTWSKWNNKIGKEQIVLQAAEWLTNSYPEEEIYAIYLVSTRICSKLKMTEYFEEFSTVVYPGSQMHPNLYHMLLDGASNEAIERINNTSVVFIDCVEQLLSALNVFVYS